MPAAQPLLTANLWWGKQPRTNYMGAFLKPDSCSGRALGRCSEGSRRFYHRRQQYPVRSCLRRPSCGTEAEMAYHNTSGICIMVLFGSWGPGAQTQGAERGRWSLGPWSALPALCTILARDLKGGKKIEKMETAWWTLVKTLVLVTLETELG